MTAPLQLTAGDEPTADPGSERDQHHVGTAAAGAVLPLRERGARGVVVDVDRLLDAFPKQPSDVEVGDAVEVGCRTENPLVGDEARHADTECVERTERTGEFDERVDQPREAAVTTWRRAAVFGEHLSVLVEQDAQALGTADVDTDRAHAHASANAFSSLMAFRIRRSARRFTKPGSGTTSSIARS
jgi:hypothetical protein